MCFAPVLTMSEAAEHPHNVARSTFVERHGVQQPAPAPASAAPCPRSPAPAHPGQHTDEVLEDWGSRRTASTLEDGAVVASPARVLASPVGRHGDPRRPDGHDRVRPRPSRRRGQRHGRLDGQAAAEGHRVVLVVCTNGDHGEVPDDLADGETLVDRRRRRPSVGRPCSASRGSSGSATATRG